jgi:hypothetical protein
MSDFGWGLVLLAVYAAGENGDATSRPGPAPPVRPAPGEG